MRSAVGWVCILRAGLSLQGLALDLTSKGKAKREGLLHAVRFKSFTPKSYTLWKVQVVSQFGLINVHRACQPTPCPCPSSHCHDLEAVGGFSSHTGAPRLWPGWNVSWLRVCCDLFSPVQALCKPSRLCHAVLLRCQPEQRKLAPPSLFTGTRASEKAVTWFQLQFQSAFLDPFPGIPSGSAGSQTTSGSASPLPSDQARPLCYICTDKLLVLQNAAKPPQSQ